jgi:hypothetical protein
MAEITFDREDLLREATALVERVELSLPADALDTNSVVAGFRKDGALSIFFRADPVYQFNAAGELRRAYCDGLLYKAVRGALVSLERVRAKDAVQLLRRDLDVGQHNAFVQNMQLYLGWLSYRLQKGEYTIVGQVPPGRDVTARVRAWLSEHNGNRIADSPRVSL